MPSNEFLRERLPIDTLGNRISESYVESKIGDGLYFTANNSETLAAASLMTILITAPATGQYYFMAECECDQPGVLTFSKVPDATATGGTALVSYNHDENSTNTNAVTQVANGTTTSLGTVLETHVLGQATDNNKAMVGFNENYIHPWRLKASREYLMVFTADLASSRTVMRTHCYRDE